MYKIYGWDSEEFHCIPCLKAKRLSEMKTKEWDGFEFVFIPIPKSNNSHPNRLELESILSGKGVELKTLPQILVQHGNELSLIGGFDEFKKHVFNIEKEMWDQ